MTTHLAMSSWQTARFTIDLAQPRVMGIVNVTPDSFSDGGAHASTAAALHHCEQLLEAVSYTHLTLPTKA